MAGKKSKASIWSGIFSLKLDKYVISILAVAFMLSLVVIGDSITGNAVSMFCENGDCASICKNDADCPMFNEVCCAKGDFGICQKTTACVKEYEFIPIYASGGENAEYNFDVPAYVIRQSVHPIIYVVVGLILLLAFLFYCKLKSIEKEIIDPKKKRPKSVAKTAAKKVSKKSKKAKTKK